MKSLYILAIIFTTAVTSLQAQSEKEQRDARKDFLAEKEAAREARVIAHDDKAIAAYESRENAKKLKEKEIKERAKARREESKRLEKELKEKQKAQYIAKQKALKAKRSQQFIKEQALIAKEDQREFAREQAAKMRKEEQKIASRDR